MLFRRRDLGLEFGVGISKVTSVTEAAATLLAPFGAPMDENREEPLPGQVPAESQSLRFVPDEF